MLITLTACDSPFGGRHYLPASSASDPYETVRAKAERYYQAGVIAERNGNLSQALKDYRQARQWDHDGRHDIQTALNRVQAQVRPQSLIEPTPTMGTTGVGMRKFQSLNFPYSIEVPAGWRAKQEGTSDQPADSFLPTSTGSGNAVVTIVVDPAPFGITLDELYVGSKQALESAGISNVQIADRRTVGGQPAYVMSYRITSDSETLFARHAIFVTPSHAWHVQLIADSSALSELVKTFNAMLESFQFQTSAFPVQ